MFLTRLIKAIAMVGAAVAGMLWPPLTVTRPNFTGPLAPPRPLASPTMTALRDAAEQTGTTLVHLVPSVEQLFPRINQPTPAKRRVPFTPQAPFANWSDPREEDGCEEASLVMAWHWLQGTDLAPAQALPEILALSRASERLIGEWRSTNAEDTARLFREYYRYDSVTVAHDITTADIAREVAVGNLVLVPTDGQKLKNPHYKQPGPPEHMLVVYGYDEGTNEFMTNDPGTRYGRDYRYPAAILQGALYDYPTGYRQPVKQRRTAMIVIEPKVSTP